MDEQPLNCGLDGSTVGEIIERVNEQGEAIHLKYDIVQTAVPNNIAIFAEDRLLDSGYILGAIELEGVPV